MECTICYANEPTYVINCGSITPHKVCDQCEVMMRMKEPATREGRILKCPMCRTPEKVPGKRTAFSYEYELAVLYKKSKNREHSCESGICMGVTTRTCSYPSGCSRHVCSNCMMCVSHFSGPLH